jgi:hypothetical protein
MWLISQLVRWPPQSFEHSIWDCVGFYTIHIFLDPSVESQLESFLSLIVSFLVQLQHLLLPSLIGTSSQVRVGTPLPLRLCCISGLGPKGLLHPPCQPTAVAAVAACPRWRRQRCWQHGNKVNKDNDNNTTTTQQPTRQLTRQPTRRGNN